MRIALALVLVVSAASQAQAGSGASLDFGVLRTQVAVSDQTAIRGEMARFGVGMRLGRHFDAGAEVEEGWLSGTTPVPDGAVARSGTGGATYASDLTGNTLALKLFAGLHTNAGAFRIGGGVAGGLRDTSVSSDLGMDIAGRKKEPLLELRTRVDLWLTSTTTVGLMATTDMIERRDLSLGAIFALQL